MEVDLDPLDLEQLEQSLKLTPARAGRGGGGGAT